MAFSRRVLRLVAATLLVSTSAALAESFREPQFTPHQPVLSQIVRDADLIFIGESSSIDVRGYRGIGEGAYSGTITPKTFLKGSMEERRLDLAWQPSATGIKPGSKHIFFLRTKDGKPEVLKEIFIHEPPYMCSRTYGAYDGGVEATIQSVKLLVSPSCAEPEYAATLLADLRQERGQRQATAIWLACETLRPECLEPLLFAITHQTERFVDAIYGACRLDGEKGASAGLSTITRNQDGYPVVFQAIAAAKNPASVAVLEKFGADTPEYRASCAATVSSIEPAKGAELAQKWEVDGKHGSHLRHFEGWVVKRAHGGFDAFNGFYCSSFPQAKTEKLASFLGKFVDVTFSEVRDEQFGGWYNGGAFDQIQRVSEIEDAPDNFPIVVTIEPTKRVFTSLEPIVARVVLKNRSKDVQPLALTSSHALLSRDYEKVFWLEPDNHYYPEKSYRFEGKPDIGKMRPGEEMAFTIESRHMAEPGKYDLSYVVSRGERSRECSSTLSPIVVISPDKKERVAVLRSWLKTAALEQRIKIATELAEMGDQEAIDEFLAQLKSGIYLDGGFFYHQAFEFAFKHGGEAGEKLMIEMIERDKFQESAQEFIQDAFFSKNWVNVLGDLLSCDHAVEMGLQDWVKHPRICDIAADVVMQRSRPKIQFPRKGAERERDAAVARVKEELKAKPQSFNAP